MNLSVISQHTQQKGLMMASKGQATPYTLRKGLSLIFLLAEGHFEISWYVAHKTYNEKQPNNQKTRLKLSSSQNFCEGKIHSVPSNIG